MVCPDQHMKVPGVYGASGTSPSTGTTGSCNGHRLRVNNVARGQLLVRLLGVFRVSGHPSGLLPLKPCEPYVRQEQEDFGVRVLLRDGE
eukprot:9088425-Pyramimonas_sp.AAC.1